LRTKSNKIAQYLEGSNISEALTYDVAIIGGGVNGCGIARDAAGRGLKVYLCEKDDLGQATSSASTKLIHGGLRYLEHYDFGLVRASLSEREILLNAMPHIAWPLRFVLPHHKGLRPAWMLRLGLFLYDHLGGRKLLPATRTVDLRSDAAGSPLKATFAKGFEYSDCWVQDSRLVVLNARDAADRSAVIEPRTTCISADSQDGLWKVEVESSDHRRKTIRARALVNASGPWAEEVISNRIRHSPSAQIRLVRGSHIVVNRLFDHDRAYIFQHSDGRIVFAIPYESDFTLIGTTDVEHDGDPGDATCTDEEARYLCTLVSEYFEKTVSPEDIVWTYSGVRPLFDDGESAASKVTRDHVIKLEDVNGAPLLNVFGGKITIYRKLAEEVLGKLQTVFPEVGGNWTSGVALPGGGFKVDDVDKQVAEVSQRNTNLSESDARRLVRTYGTEALDIVDQPNGLGRSFGHGLSEAEAIWLVEKEWARTVDDVLWRRTKLGLRFSRNEIDELSEWLKTRMKSHHPEAA
jgi:glycerol-3-phosphate dehydrogenase